MTDRVNYLVVALCEDIRIDDVESLMQAIKQFRQVADVSANVTDTQAWSARLQVREEVRDQLLMIYKALGNVRS